MKGCSSLLNFIVSIGISILHLRPEDHARFYQLGREVTYFSIRRCRHSEENKVAGFKPLLGRMIASFHRISMIFWLARWPIRHHERKKDDPLFTCHRAGRADDLAVRATCCAIIARAVFVQIYHVLFLLLLDKQLGWGEIRGCPLVEFSVEIIRANGRPAR